jgi:hypothetical protein
MIRRVKTLRQDGIVAASRRQLRKPVQGWSMVRLKGLF